MTMPTFARASHVLRVALKIFISAALIVLLLRGHDLGSIAQQMLAINRDYLAAAAAAYAALGIPSAVRWSMVLRALGYPVAVFRALLIVLIGYFFNLTLVTNIGGDSVRMWETYRAGLPRRVAITSVAIERLLQGFAHLGLVAAGVLALIYSRIGSVELRIAAALALGASLPAVAVLVSFDGLPAAWQRNRLVAPLAGFSSDLRNILRQPRVSVPGLLLGFVNQVGVLWVVYLLGKGLGLPIGFVDCVIVIPAAMLATAIPISIAGWGVRESAFVVGFGVLGIASTDALTLSLAAGALNTVVRLPGGLIWLALKHDVRAPAASSAAIARPGNPLRSAASTVAVRADRRAPTPRPVVSD